MSVSEKAVCKKKIAEYLGTDVELTMENLEKLPSKALKGQSDKSNVKMPRLNIDGPGLKAASAA